ncbi:MAG: hypothetical protein RIT81_14495 [Deltaproteobacteria bacterium]
MHSDGASDGMGRRQFLSWTGAGVIGVVSACSTTRGSTIPPERYPRLSSRYRLLWGEPIGWYEGDGEDRHAHRLPRRVDPARTGTSLVAHRRPYYDVENLAAASVPFEDFCALVGRSLPVFVHQRIDAAIAKARALADGDDPLAAAFPGERSEDVRRSLILAWAHSRDVSTIACALGYPLDVTGVHDIYEPIAVEAARAEVEKAGREQFSSWFLRYLDSVADGHEIDVGTMNPHLIADAFTWKPGVPSRDWVVVHRLSGHHRGNAMLPLDPFEGAINHVQHRREHRLGIRKASTMSFEKISNALNDQDQSLQIARSTFGAGVAKDVVVVLEKLEREGRATPWWLVDPTPAAS